MSQVTKNKHRYIQFPLCAIHEIFHNRKEALNDVIAFGIVRYSHSCSDKNGRCEPEAIARQVLYDYYRHSNILESKLIKQLKDFFKNDIIDEDDPECLFSEDGSEFTPMGLDRFPEALKTYPDFMERCKQHYQIHLAVEYLNLTISRSPVDGYNRIKDIQQENEAKFGKQPMPMLPVKMLLQFRESSEPIEYLMVYTAIKSLIGHDKFVGTNKSTILMRMIGAKSNEALKDELKWIPMRNLYKKYSTRHHFDKLIKSLWVDKFIKSNIGYKRKMWISTTLDFDELKIEVDKRLRAIDYNRQRKKARQELHELQIKIPA